MESEGDARSGPDIVPGFQLGTYRIEAQLGEGGMGVVYRAFDTKLNRPVAVKFLSDELSDTAARRRFQADQRMASGGSKHVFDRHCVHTERRLGQRQHR